MPPYVHRHKRLRWFPGAAENSLGWIKIEGPWPTNNVKHVRICLWFYVFLLFLGGQPVLTHTYVVWTVVGMPLHTNWCIWCMHNVPIEAIAMADCNPCIYSLKISMNTKGTRASTRKVVFSDLPSLSIFQPQPCLFHESFRVHLPQGISLGLGR